jgi:hypothetical protein
LLRFDIERRAIRYRPGKVLNVKVIVLVQSYQGWERNRARRSSVRWESKSPGAVKHGRAEGRVDA